MADFDAIVVGAGCAGSIAAYELAEAQKSVLVVERGDFAGAKNMTGGRLYTHSLAAVFPDFKDEAPIERRITRERISLLSPDANFSVDFDSAAMRKENSDSYSVLRASFDPWLANKAEEAGAEFVYGIPVESLIKEEGRVSGIKAGEDEITADVVILCDGVNSLLSEQAVGFSRPPASQIAVGIKQVIELPPEVITDRSLAADESEGMAWLFAGEATAGSVGGGFLYTNKESLSLGLVATLSDVSRSCKPVYQMLEDFKQHPSVAPIIRGGTVVEHSGHLVPEGGYDMMPPLVGDGVLLAGESAMMCINLGYMVRGMDYAIAAGMHAGRAAAAAIERGDTSAASLSAYAAALKESFVLQDMQQCSQVPHFMESTSRLFTEYPELCRDIFNGLFIVDGTPVTPLKKTVMPLAKRIGYTNILKDVRGALKAL